MIPHLNTISIFFKMGDKLNQPHCKFKNVCLPVKWYTLLGCSCFTHCQWDPKNCICTQFRLVWCTIKLQHKIVNLSLLSCFKILKIKLHSNIQETENKFTRSIFEVIHRLFNMNNRSLYASQTNFLYNPSGDNTCTTQLCFLSCLSLHTIISMLFPNTNAVWNNIKMGITKCGLLNYGIPVVEIIVSTAM